MKGKIEEVRTPFGLFSFLSLSLQLSASRVCVCVCCTMLQLQSGPDDMFLLRLRLEEIIQGFEVDLPCLSFNDTTELTPWCALMQKKYAKDPLGVVRVIKACLKKEKGHSLSLLLLCFSFSFFFFFLFSFLFQLAFWLPPDCLHQPFSTTAQWHTRPRSWLTLRTRQLPISQTCKSKLRYKTPCQIIFSSSSKKKANDAVFCLSQNAEIQLKNLQQQQEFFVIQYQDLCKVQGKALLSLFFFFFSLLLFFQPHTSHFVASAALQNQKADTPTPPDATGMVSEQKKKIEGIKNKKLQLEKLLSEGSLSLVPLRTVHLSSDLNCGGVVMI